MRHVIGTQWMWIQHDISAAYNEHRFRSYFCKQAAEWLALISAVFCVAHFLSLTNFWVVVVTFIFGDADGRVNVLFAPFVALICITLLVVVFRIVYIGSYWGISIGFCSIFARNESPCSCELSPKEE